MNKINEKIIFTIKENLFDETISTILIYGSQVTGLSNCDSDIDVIVTTYGNKELIGRTIIDDKIIEYHVIPMEMVYSLSADEIVMDSDRSWYSILKNSNIIYEDSNTIFIRNLIDDINFYDCQKSRKRKNRTYNSSQIIASEWYHMYQNIKFNNLFKPFIYYNLIESIRRFDFDYNNFDNIPIFKLFRLLSSSEQRENYCIDRFPNEKYMLELQEAIHDENVDSSFVKKFTDKYLIEDNLICKKIQNKNIRYQFIIISNAIERVKQSYGTFYYHYYYYILLEKIRYLYTQINNMSTSILDYDFIEPTEFNIVLIKCLKKLDIASIEELFELICKGYDINLNNYCIRV